MSKTESKRQPKENLGANRLDNTKPAKFIAEGNSAPGKHKRGKQGQ